MLLGKAVHPSGMSPAAAFCWAERLAAAVTKTPVWSAEVAACLRLTESIADENIAWYAAADILLEWPQRLAEFLDAYRRIDKHKTTSTGVGRRFGTLLRHAARLEDLGHKVPADALRHYLLERYDSGHLSGKVCLFRKPKDRATLRRRAWLTQTSAAQILGLRHSAIASLIEKGVLTGKLHSAGTNGRSIGLVSRDSVNALRRDLQNALDVKTAASRLGIGPHAVQELIHRGVLPRAVRTAKGWQVPRGSLTHLESTFHQLPKRKSRADRWISPRQATRQFGPSGLTFGGLIELILAGHVSARMADPQRRLNGVVVSKTDLDSLVPTIRNRRNHLDGYPIHQLAKVLVPGRPIKPTVLNKWIARGYLKARRRGRARVVSTQEVARFRSEFCLSDEACRLLGIARSTLSRWEVEGRIRPVYGKRVTPGAGFSLYRRKDLNGLSRRRIRRQGD
jgi:hypothetical protein